MFPSFHYDELQPEYRLRLKWLAILVGILLLVLLVDAVFGAKVEQRDEQRIKIYGSVEACQKEQRGDDCAKAFADAQQAHATNAPRFSGRDACEAKYGDAGCVAHHDDSGDWFIPAMLGFMLGHALNASAIVSQPIYADRGGMAYAGISPIGQYRSPCMVNSADPSCSSRSTGGSGGGGYVYSWGSGTSGGTPSKSSVWSSTSYSVERVTTTVSRGGFGTSASSAPTVSTRVATASAASSSSSVARGGFGSTAAVHASAGS
jgi:uncharacterized protein YgiB involved in biofilm formation